MVAKRGGNVHLLTWTGSNWNLWQDIGAPAAGIATDHPDPTIVASAPGRLDVFVKGGDSKLWQTQSTNGGATWSAWVKPVGDEGVLQSSPDATSRGPGLIDVYVIGTDNSIYQRFFDGTSWNAFWLWHGQPSAGTSGHPATISPDGVREDVFVRGGDGRLWQKTWTGTDWSSWVRPVGNEGELASAPDVTSWDPNTIVVFALGTDARMYALPFGTGGWGAWVRLAGHGDVFTSAPGADARGPQRFDVFGRGTDGVLYQIWQ